MVRKLSSAAVAIVLSLAMSACSPEDPFVPTRIIDTTIKHPAFLRIVHAAADAEPAIAVVGGSPFHGSERLPYLTFKDGVNEAQYYPADTAWKTVSFLGGGTIASSPIDMDAGAYYTAYLYGKAPNHRVLITTDTVQPNPPATQLLVRVVNLSPGSPALDVIFTTSPNDPVARGLGFGQASAYSRRTSVDFDLPGIRVVKTGTTDTVFSYPEGVFTLFGGAIMTLVVTGELAPAGDDPLLSFSAFFESSKDFETGYYGSLPIRMNLTAIRLINIVASPTNVGLDLSFHDSDFQKKFPDKNDGWRHNYSGVDSVRNVATLAEPSHVPEGYFLFGASKPGYAYRLEHHSDPTAINYTQVPVSLPDSLFIEANKRYTVVAYGPYGGLGVRTAELNDNMPRPVSGAMVRLFHGGFDQLASKRLQLRVGTVVGPLMSFGQSPDGKSSQSFEVQAGDVLLEILDEAGTVVASSRHQIRAGSGYTVFVSPHVDPSGAIIGVLIRPVIDGLVQ